MLKFADRIESLFYQEILPLYAAHPERVAFEEDFPRMLFYLQVLHKAGVIRDGAHVLDLGTGLSPFPLFLQHLGVHVTIVDDFGGGGGVGRNSRSATESVLTSFDRTGVKIVTCDFLVEQLPLQSESLNAVTCFHSLEHWHQSPKRLFGEIQRVLSCNGVVFLATPNSVNIRKRLSVLAGNSNHCELEEWYFDGEPFRGHVREPNISDLCKLLEWNGFVVEAIFGKNFIGKKSTVIRNQSKFVRSTLSRIGQLLNPVLELKPSFCSDIHVLGRKIRS